MTLKNRIMPEERIGKLKQLIDSGKLVRVIEAHNGLSAIIGNDTTIDMKEGRKEFNAIWASSLSDSASKGYPDAEIVGFDSRLKTINEILEVSNKPVIVDGDTGRDINNFEYMVKKLERIGVSAVIIEDKMFPKRNSLDNDAKQILEDPNVFAEKIKRGKERSVNNTSYQKVPEVDKVYHDIDEEFNETNTGRIVISFPEGKLMISGHLELLEAYEREKKTLKKVKEASYVLGLNYDLSFVDELILSYCWQNDFRLITNDENLRNAYEIGKIIKKYEKIGTTNSGAKKILSEIKKYLEKRGIR